MAGWKLDDRFDIAANATLLGFLKKTNPSAHSDVADELVRAGSGVSGVRSYCPDLASYAFMALHRADWTLIGLAFGQSSLAFRIPYDARAEAVQSGGAPAPDLGPGWILFPPWRDTETLEQSRRRLAYWCSVAAAGHSDF